eukprot:TRINITY_DN8232_c0_g1_i1.p1 TRINITY_DN8232_c0_g1~~TRINITY_DN8232_c0_g1_i1.p1  ORF type:complete len:263 (-),score=60.76 TRINITY_DN8232_c0_g1_i1:46-834(-)
MAAKDFTFYYADLCPFAQRAWIVVLEKNAPHTPVLVDLFDKPADFLEVSNTVPAGKHNGKALTESLEMSEYVDDAFPGNPLQPTDPYEKFQYKLKLKVTTSIVGPFYEFLQTVDQVKQDEARTKLENALDAVEKAIVGPYYLGEQFSLIDTALFPFAERIVALLPRYRNWNLLEKTDRYPKINKWYKTTSERPSVKRTTADRDEAALAAVPAYANKERIAFLQEVYEPYAVGKAAQYREFMSKRKSPPSREEVNKLLYGTSN